VFGAPEPVPDHAERAVRTALAMGEASRRFAAELARDGVAFGRTRIGVHSGAAVIGNVGGSRRFDYTAIGDVVNTASRLEGANRFFGTEICFSDATRLLAPAIPARPIGGLVLKGRTTELPVFTPVVGEPEERTQSYLAAYELLERGSPEALNAFEAHLEKYPDDDLARFHRNRLAADDVTVRIVLEGK
jgi:adenylate cyclase